MQEPRIHSHIIDILPDGYKGLNDKAKPFKSVYCDQCDVMVHAGNNECMQTWIETRNGNFCTDCLVLQTVLNDDWPQEGDLK
jgi:hypothetical protein